MRYVEMATLAPVSRDCLSVYTEEDQGRNLLRTQGSGEICLRAKVA